MSDDGHADQATITVLTAEYTALREEVGRCQDHRNQLFSIALAMMAAIVALAGVANHGERQANEVNIVFLLAPLLFVFLGSAYIDRGRRLLLAAIYIHTSLRTQVSELLNKDVWQWETFKRRRYEKYNHFIRITARTLDGLRGMIFVACGGISLGLYLALPHKSPSTGRVALLIGDLGLLLALVVLIWISQETRGLEAEAESSGRWV